MTYATYADLLRPSSRRYAQLYDIALVLGGSLLIGLCAQIAIPLPFSPVPITGQTCGVLLAGALLGSRRGALCLLTYLAEGVAGLPLFAGGAMGLAYLFGPTGGYLFSFPVAAYLTGRLAEQGWDRQITTNFLAMLLGNAVIYAVGLPWLAVFTGTGTLALGFYPFIVGDILKLMLATLVLPFGWTVLRR